MNRLTPEAREELREQIAIKLRRKAREEREQAPPVPLEVGRHRVRSGRGRVLHSPSGVAHIALNDTGFLPICNHYAAGEPVGWTTYPESWENLPHDVRRCKTCIQLS